MAVYATSGNQVGNGVDYTEVRLDGPASVFAFVALTNFGDVTGAKAFVANYTVAGSPDPVEWDPQGLPYLTADEVTSVTFGLSIDVSQAVGGASALFVVLTDPDRILLQVGKLDL